MHTIVNNVELGFLEITVVGFWEPDELDAFAADLRRAIQAFPDIGRPPGSLYNFTRAAIQSQQVVRKMREMAASPAFAGRRVALYTDGGLARLQARRVAMASDTMRVFESRAEAVAWMVGAESPAVSAACGSLPSQGPSQVVPSRPEVPPSGDLLPGFGALPCAPSAPTWHGLSRGS
jgi:hypothetical protein